MSDKTSMSVWSYLLSSEARMTIIVPILIYNLTFWGVGAGAALIVTACYSALLELFSKRSGSLSIIALILVSGTIHYLYLHGYTLFGVDQESVLLSVGGSLSVIAVFGFYSMIGRPVVRTQAENALPRLKQLPVYGSPKYAQVWQEISLVWILAYAVKALLVIKFSRDMPDYADYFVFIGAWPLTLAMIAFSFYWPGFRWSSEASA
ncbi:hypothetical protein [Vibrio coralliilyticus]|uniref:hypothetical protein n=1 Tax=Vibrio coralliilyticus TaxID=190893 RepID=UPI0017B33C57|nr:hypothetical protein [Vibrio coralliilyticus]NUW70255.1 hypothetical protein [Vibrio coralliilyticus]